ncbi:MAG: hypothetical protein EXS44_01645 [Candidatus Levybacteria bacterium]|nr:hypothetical protein [Candidatus Levybacteria bacterium]
MALVYLNGLEEILSGFQFDDPWMVWFGNLFETKTEVFYWTFHIMWWILVPVAVFLLIGGRKMVYTLLALFGLVYFTEIHHTLKGLLSDGYYPGMVTSVIYPILGIFYWRQLSKDWKRNN